MRQRGRKSAASIIPLSLTGTQPRITVPPGLTTAERNLFTEIVNTAPPKHFVKSDVLLITSLVQATLLVRRAAAGMIEDEDQVAVFEKAVKLQGMLATRLRLAPQSRMNSRQTARETERHYTGPQPWITEGDDDDAEEEIAT
jgi:hypothetical protein